MNAGGHHHRPRHGTASWSWARPARRPPPWARPGRRRRRANAGAASINANGLTLDLTSATGANGWTPNSGAAYHHRVGTERQHDGGRQRRHPAGRRRHRHHGGGAGLDSLTGGTGNGTMTGGAVSTFNVDAGTDTISDLAGGSGDILKVSAGATATGTRPATGRRVPAQERQRRRPSRRGILAQCQQDSTGTTGYTLTSTGGAATLTGSSQNDILNAGQRRHLVGWPQSTSSLAAPVRTSCSAVSATMP